MKKILSVLLALVLVIGLFPVTAPHAHAATADSTVTYTFSNYAAGSQYAKNEEHVLDEDVTVVTNDCHFTTQLRIYSSSSNNGYAIIKCTADNFAFSGFGMNAGNKVDTVKIYGSNDDGATWTEIGSLNTTTTSYKDYSCTFTDNYRWLKLDVAGSNQVRLAKISLTFAATATGGDSCAHANTTTTTENASCTSAGSITVTCNDCGETISTEEIAALGHSYVGGVCSRCGEEEPEVVGYVLTDINLISSDQKVIIVGNNGSYYAMSNNNGTSKAPAAVAVTVDGTVLTLNDGTDAATVEWNVVKNADGSLSFYPAGDASKWLYCTGTNNGVRVGTNTANAFVLDASGYLKHSGTNRYVGIYNSQDWRCYTSTSTNIGNQTFGFYVLNEKQDTTCQHTNTEDVAEIPATCTTTGVTAGVKCADCNTILSGCEIVSALGHAYGEGEVTEAAGCLTAGVMTYTCANDPAHTKTEEIAALGHNYVDGICSNCGDELVDLSGKYFVAAKRTGGGNFFYMTNDLGTASTKRYQAVDSGLAELPESVAAVSGQVFVLVNVDGTTYKIYAEGVDGDNYLGWNSGNSGALVSEENAKVVNVAFNDDGSVKITFANNSETRKLTLNNNSGNNYFAWYATEQANVYLIPVEEACQHTNTTTSTVPADCENEGSVTVTCDDCGEIISAETIDALGHSYVAETTPADCTNDGKTVYTCSACGDSYEEAIGALGHNYVGVVTTPATCTTDGVKTYTCSNCNDSYEEVIPAGHTIEHVPAVVPANCQETGHDEYWYCAGCDAYFGDAEASYQVNPAWINYTGEHVRPEGAAICAVVPCELCGEDSYGEPCDRGDAPECQDAPCVNCGETVWGWGCNYNTGDEEVPLPLCQPGDCVYCGTHYDKLYDCENGSWAPCTYDGECAYGCGKQYPATGIHELDNPCEGGMCWICWEEIPGAHSYESVVTAPTATKEGYTTHTCVNCGDSYTDSVVPAIGIGELGFSGANLALHNDLSINLYADANLFIEDAYTAPYVVCEFGYKTMTITDYKIVDGKYVFTCDGISPSQIGDAVNVTLHATLNGEENQVSYEYGVAAYCYNMLAKTDDSKLKTLLVDLLNYGAAAQEYASYKNSTLCNADLTEEQRSWGTQSVPAVSSVLNTKYATVENAKAKWKGASLYLENNVSIRARFAAESIEGLSVKATIGDTTYVITEFEADAANPGSYIVYFDQINASQMRETVYLTVCEGDTAVSNTVTYSVESYVAAKLNDSNVKLANLVASIIKYGDAAYNLNH